MSINVECVFCEEELEEPGGLLFGKPIGGMVAKDHVCVGCLALLWKLMTMRRVRG